MELVLSYRDDLRFARKGRTWALLALPVALLLVLPFVAPLSWTVRATLVWLTAIGVLGQNLLIGNAGLASFGQAGFLAIGAFAYAHLRHAGVPFLPGAAGGGLLAALFGVLLGFPALRLKGPYLAIATLGFGTAVYQVLSSSERLSGGRTGMEVPRLAPLFGLSRNVLLYYVYLLLLLAFLALTYNLVSSWVGRSLAAVRDSDVAAEAVGVSSRRVKLLAFALSSFYVGVEGALLAQFLGHVEPQNFTITESLTLFAAVIVGGLASVEGALFGAAFVVLVPAMGSEAGWFTPLVFGVALLLVMLFEPEGMAGRWRKLRLYFESWPFR
jgi:branched-chain amino acid transport system permease protein